MKDAGGETEPAGWGKDTNDEGVEYLRGLGAWDVPAIQWQTLREVYIDRHSYWIKIISLFSIFDNHCIIVT
jgi:hypothetical protein